ncbi:MAG TPA: hypothetical protein VFQ26_07290, partial [Nitrospiraceae bacterium]|nr:hypothetical protein [Nitrospiraceae bacterium]
MTSYWGVEHGEVSKKEKKDYSGAAVGAGGTVGTVGLVGGGLPGTKAKGTLADVKNATTRGSKARSGLRAYQAGEFGYRHNAHHTYKTFGLGGDSPKDNTRAAHYWQGEKAGKVASEDKIIRHLKMGHRASNVALVGGAALAGAGAYQHHKRKQGVAKAAKKKDHFGANAAIGGGAATAVTGGGLARTLEHQGRKWSKDAAHSYQEAAKVNPKLGGYDTDTSNYRVPDIKPHKGTRDVIREGNEIFAGKSRTHAEAAGRLRGAGAQQRYFAKTYAGAGKIARKVGYAGAAVGAAGLGAKYLSDKKVKKNLAMPKGIHIPGTSAITDLKGAVQFKSQLPKLHQGNPQRVLHTTRRPKRKLVRTGARNRAMVTGGVAKSYDVFLEMPGALI